MKQVEVIVPKGLAEDIAIANQAHALMKRILALTVTEKGRPSTKKSVQRALQTWWQVTCTCTANGYPAW
jgi:hypothetical protein